MKQLSLIEKAFFLKRVSLFEDLDLDMLIAIADKMNQDIYDKDEIVFEKTHKPLRMYFIAKGSVDLLDTKDLSFATIPLEHFFGDEALFSDTLRTYKAICKEPTLLLTLTKTNLLTIISECPSVAIALLSQYAKTKSCRLKKDEDKN